MCNTNTELKAVKVKMAKDHCICWTIYCNISQWFENWEYDLVDLGTAGCNPITGKVTIPAKQLKTIINLALTLDRLT